jgi:hypothetical protein
MGTYRENFLEKISKIDGVSLANLPELTFANNTAAINALDSILDHGCKCQNELNILLGREFLSKFSLQFLEQHLIQRASTVLDFSDDYEFRRLCEAVELIDRSLLEQVLVFGDSIDNAEIREAISDYREQLA